MNFLPTWMMVYSMFIRKYVVSKEFSYPVDEHGSCLSLTFVTSRIDNFIHCRERNVVGSIKCLVKVNRVWTVSRLLDPRRSIHPRHVTRKELNRLSFIATVKYHFDRSGARRSLQPNHVTQFSISTPAGRLCRIYGYVV
jgi:hypothetical protein